MSSVNPLPSPQEGLPASQFPDLLTLMHAVGVWMSAQHRATYQAWGHHLLEDWRTLELLADHFRDP